MNVVTRCFFRGLIALLPISLSLYAIFIFFRWAEDLSHQLLRLIFPKIHYVPGMGILFGLSIIFFLGLLMGSAYTRKIYSAIEMPFKNVPLVKSIYVAIKDLTTFFSPNKKQTSQVVVIKYPGVQMDVIGFVTRKDLTRMPDGIEKQDRVAVYIPLSYQIGGVTVFVPNKWLTKLDISVEEAMRSSLTAWMPSHPPE